MFYSHNYGFRKKNVSTLINIVKNNEKIFTKCSTMNNYHKFFTTFYNKLRPIVFKSIILKTILLKKNCRIKNYTSTKRETSCYIRVKTPGNLSQCWFPMCTQMS